MDEERDRLGLKKGQIAEMCGIARETWSRYKNDESRPGFDVLSALAAIGADVQYIVTGIRSLNATGEVTGQEPALVPVSHEELNLLINLAHCGVEERQAVYRHAAAVAAAAEGTAGSDNGKAAGGTANTAKGALRRRRKKDDNAPPQGAVEDP